MTTQEVVFKVKYGDKFKRINEYGVTFVQLRSKIREGFKITPEKVINLTYIDEDGDTVLLDNEADLYAALKQGLNPLRIDMEVPTVVL